MMTTAVDLKWSGTLSVFNVYEVADALRVLLTGKKFMVVKSHELFGFELEAKRGLSLQPQPPLSLIHAELGSFVEPSATITFSDDDYLWLLSTSWDRKDVDSKYEAPFFKFEGDRVTIKMRTPAGQLKHLLFLVEGDLIETKGN